MKRPIAAIVWPTTELDSVQLLLRYMLRILEQLDISFGHPAAEDPISIVKGLLSGELSDDDRQRALSRWWSLVDQEGIRSFDNQRALSARLAVCLLAPSVSETSNLGEQLSWFLEVLGLIGADVDIAIDTMERHFDFNEGTTASTRRQN